MLQSDDFTRYESDLSNSFYSTKYCLVGSPLSNQTNDESHGSFENIPRFTLPEVNVTTTILTKPTLSSIEENNFNNNNVNLPLPCLPGEKVNNLFKFIGGFIAITNYRLAVLYMKSTFMEKLFSFSSPISTSHSTSSSSVSSSTTDCQKENFNLLHFQRKLSENEESSYHSSYSDIENLSTKQCSFVTAIGDDNGDNDDDAITPTNAISALLEDHHLSRVKGLFLPLQLLWKVDIIDLVHCRIVTKTGGMLKITFSDNSQCSLLRDAVGKEILQKESSERLFAFEFYKHLPKTDIISQVFLNAPVPIHTKMEFKRMEFPEENWTVVHVNKNFSICRTYPEYHIVPINTTETSIKEMASFRQLNRFPSIVWRSKRTGAVMLRCSQPCVGLIGSRNKEDENFIASVLQTCQKDSLSSGKRLLIVDARHYSAAFYNCFRGGGFENVQNYPNVDIEWKNLPNIHSVRSSFEKLIFCIHSCPEQWLSSFEATDWLNFLGQLLRASYDVAQTLHVKGCPVMIHCTDGWDRTPQLTSLAQILLDPYYRTIQGFQHLIEREWLDYGHKFADRCGHRTHSLDINELSPVFIQFLDCVHQLSNQYPLYFQFNQLFLIKLGCHAYSTLFGTFLCNSPQERNELNLIESTCSLWSFLFNTTSNGTFVNHLYKENSDILIPSFSSRDLVLWRGMFLDDANFYGDHEFDCNNGGSGSGGACCTSLPIQSQPFEECFNQSTIAFMINNRPTMNNDEEVEKISSHFSFLSNEKISSSHFIVDSSSPAATLDITLTDDDFRLDHPTMQKENIDPTDLNNELEINSIDSIRNDDSDELLLQCPPEARDELNYRDNCRTQVVLHSPSSDALYPSPPQPKARLFKKTDEITNDAPIPLPRLTTTRSKQIQSPTNQLDLSVFKTQISEQPSQESQELRDHELVDKMNDFFKWASISTSMLTSVLGGTSTPPPSSSSSSNKLVNATLKNQIPWKLKPRLDLDGMIDMNSRVDPYNPFIQRLHHNHISEKQKLKMECERHKDELQQLRNQLEFYKNKVIEKECNEKLQHRPRSASGGGGRGNGNDGGQEISINSLLLDAMKDVNDSYSPLTSNSASSSFSSFVNVETSGIVMWFPDHVCHTCGDCQVTFSSIMRRHHCRSCGLVFCHTCSNYYIPVPHQNLPHPSRVCRLCMEKLTDCHQNNDNSQQQIEANNLSPTITPSLTSPSSSPSSSQCFVGSKMLKLVKPPPPATTTTSFSLSSSSSSSSPSTRCLNHVCDRKTPNNEVTAQA